MSELKPCPFCGAEPYELELDIFSDLFFWYEEIHCLKCNLRMRVPHKDKPQDMHEIFERWNRRVDNAT